MNNPPLQADLALPPPRRGPLVAGWVLFWLLMITVALHDHARAGGKAWWQPLLWEGSAALVATPLVAWMLHRLPRLDGLLATPSRWFWHVLRELPLWAPLYVSGVYALRHGVYALLGQVYRHDPWPLVYRYEMIKFALFYSLFAAALFGLRSHAALGAARLREERSRALTRQAQLQQLAQQIEPHFLFNALNTIAATVHTDAALADRLITRLAALLRAASDSQRRVEHPLDDELRLLEAYASIMLERFAGRASLRWLIDERSRGCMLPTLALQPLLENAFRHGVEPNESPVELAIEILRLDDRVAVRVLQSAGAPDPAAAEGVGLANLRQRLAARYGERATLELRARPEGGAEARLEWPCEC